MKRPTRVIKKPLRFKVRHESRERVSPHRVNKIIQREEFCDNIIYYIDHAGNNTDYTFACIDDINCAFVKYVVANRSDLITRLKDESKCIHVINKSNQTTEENFQYDVELARGNDYEWCIPIYADIFDFMKSCSRPLPVVWLDGCRTVARTQSNAFSSPLDQIKEYLTSHAAPHHTMMITVSTRTKMPHGYVGPVGISLTRKKINRCLRKYDGEYLKWKKSYNDGGGPMMCYTVEFI